VERFEIGEGGELTENDGLARIVLCKCTASEERTSKKAYTEPILRSTGEGVQFMGG